MEFILPDISNKDKKYLEKILIPPSFFLLLSDPFFLEFFLPDGLLKLLPRVLVNSGIPDRFGFVSVGSVFVVGQIFAIEFDERFFEFRRLTMIGLKKRVKLLKNKKLKLICTDDKTANILTIVHYKH